MKSAIINVLAAGTSGVLLWASLPFLSISSCAWVALVPLLLLIAACGTAGACALSYLAGWIMFAGLFYWIPVVPAFSWSGYLLLVTYLATYFGLFGLLLTVLHRRTGATLSLLAPPLWLALEYARGHAGFLGASWMLLGHSQFEHPILLQISAVTGAYGVSFVVVLVNAACADWILSCSRCRRSWRPARAGYRRARVSLGMAAGTVALCVLFGVIRLNAPSMGGLLRVSVVQGNIPQAHKWEPAWRERIVERHVEFTRQAADDRPALIVWPETSVPGDVVHDAQLRSRMADLARETGSYLLAGSASQAKGEDRTLVGKKFNSMVLLAPDGTLTGEYRKVLLVPFAEYAPIRQAALWVQEQGAPWQDMVAGSMPKVLSAGSVKIGTPICWENIFPELFRQLAAQGAHLMVNATNEAWFGESSASEQFLAMSVFRAVENHVAIARAANTGISSFIDPYGRVTGRLAAPNGKELFVEGVLTQDIPLTTERTFYTRHGDVFVMTQAVACLSLCLWALFAEKRPRLHPVFVVTSQGERT